MLHLQSFAATTSDPKSYNTAGSKLCVTLYIDWMR